MLHPRKLFFGNNKKTWKKSWIETSQTFSSLSLSSLFSSTTHIPPEENEAQWRNEEKESPFPCELEQNNNNNDKHSFLVCVWIEGCVVEKFITAHVVFFPALLCWCDVCVRALKVVRMVEHCHVFVPGCSPTCGILLMSAKTTLFSA